MESRHNEFLHSSKYFSSPWKAFLISPRIHGKEKLSTTLEMVEIFSKANQCEGELCEWDNS